MADASQQDAQQQQAERARRVVVRAFEQAYEDAGLRGLCAEGRYEAAIEAARKLDLGSPCRFIEAPLTSARGRIAGLSPLCLTRRKQVNRDPHEAS